MDAQSENKSVGVIVAKGILGIIGVVLMALLNGLRGLGKLLTPSRKSAPDVGVWVFAVLAVGCAYIGWQTEFTPAENFWWLIAAIVFGGIQLSIWKKSLKAFAVSVVIALVFCFANNLLTAQSIETVQSAIGGTLSLGIFPESMALLGALVFFGAMLVGLFYIFVASFGSARGRDKGGGGQGKGNSSDKRDPVGTAEDVGTAATPVRELLDW